MIVERIDRSGHVIDVYSFHKNRIAIGRGYTNDLIVHDIYAEDRHVLIEFDYLHDHFLVTDLGSLNGVSSLEKNKIKQKKLPESNRVCVNSGDSIVIGKTRLRLLTKEHKVAPAKLLSSLDSVLSKVGSWWFLLVAVALVLATEAISAYLSDPFTQKLYKDMVEGLYVLFAAVFYGGVWALIARIQRLDGRFLMHVNILLLASVIAGVYLFIHPILVFNFEWLMYKGYISKILMALGAFAAIYASCYQSTNLSAFKRSMVSLLLPAFILLGTVISEMNRPDFRARPPYNMVMVSPGWQWRSSMDVQDFLSESEELYQSAEED